MKRTPPGLLRLHLQPASQRKPWKERIRHFSWAWWTVVMGTGVLSSLAHAFPYGGPYNPALRGLFMFFFMTNFVFFLLIGGATIARYIMFPEVWGKMIMHPAQSMFLGAFPMGCATLINAGLIANQEWGWGGKGFLFALWGFWWLDSMVSYSIAFGMLYVMMVRQDHSLAKMTAVWLLPFVTIIVASSTGGDIAVPMLQHYRTLAILTAGFSFTMVLIGLSLACMMITIYLLRLIVHGPPDISLILSAFIVLGPLGQGGFSLLASGQNISMLLPAHMQSNFPNSPLTGQILYGVAFAGAYLAWSAGFCWVIIACISIGNQLRKGKIPFSLAYWGMVFPHGVYARLCCQLALVLQSPFFRVYAAFWCTLTAAIWLTNVIMTIPALIDGSIFKAPYLADPEAGLPTAISRKPPPAPGMALPPPPRFPGSRPFDPRKDLPLPPAMLTPSEKFESQVLYAIGRAGSH